MTGELNIIINAKKLVLYSNTNTTYEVPFGHYLCTGQTE